MDKDIGRESRLSQAEPVARLGPTGFDPARIYGYFDGPGDTPAHDPGEGAPCPACGEPVTREGVRCQSILVPGDYRCYFIRYHITCADDPRVEEAVHWIVEQRGPVADAINEADGTTAEEKIAGYMRGAQCLR